MAERPLLNLPAPEPIEPRVRGGGGPNVVRPNRDRQRERIEPRFERLARVAQNPADILALRDDPASIAPERAIVFEVEGALEDFYSQARLIGLEYLGDYEEEIGPSDDFFDEKHPENALAGRIYLAMPDIRALQELLGLWNIYKNNGRMPNGRGPWRELFSRLIDVRPWGPVDRVPEESIRSFREELARAPDAPVRLEIELWFHDQAERRTNSFRNLSDRIARSGGQVVHHAVIPEIRYDAILTDLPAAEVEALIAHPNVGLARSDEVMFLRPQSMARSPFSEPEGENVAGLAPLALPAVPEPIVALLDGLPVENHQRLVGRLRIDDPDGVANAYPVAQREHGTEMASLIIHGDLNHNQVPLGRPLYVRPILQPSQIGERTPSDRLVVDVIHEAIRRMKVGYDAEPPSAPQVIIVNLSIGDEKRPFARAISPLARLLDYLSWRYRLLFIVSAGNIPHRFRIDGYQTWQEFERAAPEDRELAVLTSLNAQKSQRTLLSPAESINSLTVGAAHQGSAYNGAFPADRIDPYMDESLPSAISAMGLGFKRVVKPELLLGGGRAPLMMAVTGGELWVRLPQGGARFFGLRVARPDQAGNVRFEDHTWGTSAATALATRAAHLIHDSLLDEAGGSNHANATSNELPLLVKALLVHSARWSDKGAMLDGVFQPQGRGSHFARRDDITRLLGYGVPNIQRVLDCTENRATLVGVGAIESESAVLYRVPLPEDLDGVRALRSLTITVAWFSPINSRHQGYRMAALDVSGAGEDKYWIAEDRDAYQPTDQAVLRGTVIHEHRSGEAAKVFVDDGHLLIRVGCRATAGTLDGPIPYAMAVSFEVAAAIGIPVYEQVRARLAVPVRAGQ